MKTMYSCEMVVIFILLPHIYNFLCVIFTIKLIFVIQLCISELSLDTKKAVCHLHNLNLLTFKL